MKNKLNFLLVMTFIFVLSSCTVDPKSTVKDPKKETTIYVQELPRDTVLISIDDGKMYIFDKNNTMIVKGEIFNHGFVEAAYFICGIIYYWYCYREYQIVNKK